MLSRSINARFLNLCFLRLASPQVCSLLSPSSFLPFISLPLACLLSWKFPADLHRERGADRGLKLCHLSAHLAARHLTAAAPLTGAPRVRWGARSPSPCPPASRLGPPGSPGRPRRPSARSSAGRQHPPHDTTDRRPRQPGQQPAPHVPAEPLKCGVCGRGTKYFVLLTFG